MLTMLEVMQPYDNYIYALRRKIGLSQEELAFLMDDQPQRIQSYEQQANLPQLHRALALELVLDEPMQSIFAGIAKKMRMQVAARARALLQGMSDKPSPSNAQKLETLHYLGQIDDEEPAPCKEVA